MEYNDCWLKVKKISKDIYLIDDNGGDTIYIVNGSGGTLLIDTGWGIGNLKESLAQLATKPLTVVNTHGHPDHVSGNYQFPEVHINPGDIFLLEDCFTPRSKKWAAGNVLKDGPFPRSFSIEDWIEAKNGGIVPIDDGHVFDLGDRKIEAVAIPGHSPGCIGLLDREDGIFFSGDSILAGDIWMYLEESTPLSTYLSSLKKVKGLCGSFDRILPAHGTRPLEVGIIDELIAGVTGILEGRRTGKFVRTFAGEGLLCRFETCGVIYNKNRL